MASREAIKVWRAVGPAACLVRSVQAFFHMSATQSGYDYLIRGLFLMGAYLKPLAAVVVVAVFALAGHSQRKPLSPERTLFEAANRERISRGLPLLHWDSTLADAARQHAMEMSHHNTISHQFTGEPNLEERAGAAGARFAIVAENVAEGPDAKTIHESWMNSPPHRANLLDPKVNSLGVGLAERAGQMFAVEDFSQSVAVLSLERQEQLVSVELTMRGLRLTGSSGEARHACRLGSSYHPTRSPVYVLHYTTTDLENLPQPLVDEVKSGAYHLAAVGACVPDRSTGFTNFRIAVMLYP